MKGQVDSRASHNQKLRNKSISINLLEYVVDIVTLPKAFIKRPFWIIKERRGNKSVIGTRSTFISWHLAPSLAVTVVIRKPKSLHRSNEEKHIEENHRNDPNRETGSWSCAKPMIPFLRTLCDSASARSIHISEDFFLESVCTFCGHHRTVTRCYYYHFAGWPANRPRRWPAAAGYHNFLFSRGRLSPIPSAQPNWLDHMHSLVATFAQEPQCYGSSAVCLVDIGNGRVLAGTIEMLGIGHNSKYCLPEINLFCELASHSVAFQVEEACWEFAMHDWPRTKPPPGCTSLCKLSSDAATMLQMNAMWRPDDCTWMK